MREVGSGELLELLQEVFENVPHETIVARYKYFQRREFPAGKPRGAGYRMGYDQASIWKLVLAFELLRNWMSPADAMLVVERLWNELAQAIAITFGGIEEDPDDPPGFKLWIHPTALAATDGEKSSAMRTRSDVGTEGDSASDDSRPRLVFEALQPFFDLDDVGVRSGIALDLQWLVEDVYSTAALKPFRSSKLLATEMEHWSKGRGTGPF